MRIALFTLDSALSAEAVLEFCRRRGNEIVFIGLSNPYRPQAGGLFGQIKAHWRRSGPRILPFLLVNYGLPQTLGALRRALGRGPLSRFARRYGIPIQTIDDVNSPSVASALAAARPDLILSFHFDQIFRAETLAMAPLGGFNAHPSLLPHHRGPLPTFWAQMERQPRFGVTLHRLAPRIDAGGILAQQPLRLPPGTSASEAARLLHQLATPMAEAVIDRLAQGELPAEAHPPVLPYCPFPPASLLREAARQGCHLLRWRDLLAAFGAPTG